ncbi:MAG: hypothetical protein AAF909_03475 [Pseudomonadota bacterium]
MGFIGSLIWSIAAFLATLILEILLALAIYVFLDINYRDLFGALTNWARETLSALLSTLSDFAPSLYTAANQSVAGEISATGFLLLVIGLFASGVIRLIAWMVRRAVRGDA